VGSIIYTVLTFKSPAAKPQEEKKTKEKEVV